ncbi:MAG: DUF5678 domain-containing protein [Acidobacteriota bacterium]
MSTKTLPEVRKSRLPYGDRSRETAWIAEHWREYAGEWVLLDEDRLIAHGDDPLPFREKARAEGINIYLVHLPKNDAPFTGGWQ